MTTVKKTMEQMNGDVATMEKVALDEKVIKKIVVASLVGVDGFLGTAGGLLHGKSATEAEDVYRHIAIRTDKEGRVSVRVRAIAEEGKSIPVIVDAMTANVIKALREVGGLDTKAVDIEVVDTMTTEAYAAKHIKAAKAEE